ncbi:MAG: ECF-type sigma factor [Woeseiaceae bacterium]
MDNKKIASLLAEWAAGDLQALDTLVSECYPLFKKIAIRQMDGERKSHTLQATGLVNEAFLRLRKMEPNLVDAAHLKNLVGVVMRRILVDHAKSKRRKKRGGDVIVESLTMTVEGESATPFDVLALDTALTSLEDADYLSAAILQCYYFGGMTYREIAVATNLAESTVHSKLRTARAWLASSSER